MSRRKWTSHRRFIPNTRTETGFQSERQDGHSRLRKCAVYSLIYSLTTRLKLWKIAQSVSRFYFIITTLCSWEPNICLHIQGENGSLIWSLFLFHSLKDKIIAAKLRFSIYIVLYHSMREGSLNSNSGNISISTIQDTIVSVHIQLKWSFLI